MGNTGRMDSWNWDGFSVQADWIVTNGMKITDYLPSTTFYLDISVRYAACYVSIAAMERTDVDWQRELPMTELNNLVLEREFQ